MNLAIFASGRGSNFSSIARAVKRGKIKANLTVLVCDNPFAAVIGKAKRANVRVALVKREDCKDKKDFENRIIAILEQEKIDLVVLAGFMRMLTSGFVVRFRNKIINIHPAILPAFKGGHAIGDAFDYGVKVTGVTVHFVDEKMDHGPIILQEQVLVSEKDTLATLEEKIHRVEHRLYPKAIQLFVEKKIKINGRKVKISI